MYCHAANSADASTEWWSSAVHVHKVFLASSYTFQYPDRPDPTDHVEIAMREVYEITSAPTWPQMFGNAGKFHMELYGTSIVARGTALN